MVVIKEYIIQYKKLRTNMKTDELTITGLLFSGIVLAGMYLNSQHQINKQLNELQSNYT